MPPAAIDLQMSKSKHPMLFAPKDETLSFVTETTERW